MGYETKLLIGVKYTPLGEEKESYFSVIASIDLCKSDFGDTWIDESDKHESNLVYFYGTDGDTKITEDHYGSKLYSINPKKVLDFIKEHNAKKYRRYNAAAPLLKSLINGFKGENLQCILYGH